MTFRMEVWGTSLCGAVIAGAGDLAAAGARRRRRGGRGRAAAGGGGGVPPFCAASISARMMRPLGPLPVRADRSMPASRCHAASEGGGEIAVRRRA